MRVTVKLVLGLLVAGLTVFGAQAQEQKTERQIVREWKKRQRAMSPLDFKKMSEDYDNLKVETTRLSSELVAQTTAMDSLKQEVTTLKNTVDVQKDAYNELMAKFEKANEQLEQAAMMVDAAPVVGKGKGKVGGSRALARGELLTKSSGYVFSVQVGVIEKQAVAPKFANSAILVKDETSGLQRVMMGMFRNFAAADQLKEQMRELGIRTAWVVAYKDGKRVSVTSALAAVNSQSMNLARK